MKLYDIIPYQVNFNKSTEYVRYAVYTVLNNMFLYFSTDVIFDITVPYNFRSRNLIRIGIDVDERTTYTLGRE